MDETAKILIGTISGFIIAFFAEPVKIYFQSQAKKKKMRSALYHEIFFNYVSLSSYLNNSSNDELEASFITFRAGITGMVRTDCYQHYISVEADTYYQLKEAVYINFAYTNIIKLVEFANQEISESRDPRRWAKTYITWIQNGLTSGELDIKVFNNALGKSTVKSVFKNI